MGTGGISGDWGVSGDWGIIGDRGHQQGPVVSSEARASAGMARLGLGASVGLFSPNADTAVVRPPQLSL